MKLFEVFATITGNTENFNDANGYPVKDGGYVVFHPKAESETEAAETACRIAKLAGCSASIKLVRER